MPEGVLSLARMMPLSERLETQNSRTSFKTLAKKRSDEAFMKSERSSNFLPAHLVSTATIKDGLADLM